MTEDEKLRSNTFVAEIKLGNDAMKTGRDLAEALREVADWIETCDDLAPYHSRSIFDENGNTVGSYNFLRDHVVEIKKG